MTMNRKDSSSRRTLKCNSVHSNSSEKNKIINCFCCGSLLKFTEARKVTKNKIMNIRIKRDISAERNCNGFAKNVKTICIN